METITNLIQRTKRERKRKPCEYVGYKGGSPKRIVKPVYFFEGDDDMSEIYEALTKISPSRTSSGPNVSAYLRSHKEQILAEAKETEEKKIQVER